MRFRTNQMQLPQYIIDLVGNLYDEGLDDESICLAVLKTWEMQEHKFPGKDTKTFL